MLVNSFSSHEIVVRPIWDSECMTIMEEYGVWKVHRMTYICKIWEPSDHESESFEGFNVVETLATGWGWMSICPIEMNQPASIDEDQENPTMGHALTYLEEFDCMCKTWMHVKKSKDQLGHKTVPYMCNLWTAQQTVLYRSSLNWFNGLITSEPIFELRSSTG